MNVVADSTQNVFTSLYHFQAFSVPLFVRERIVILVYVCVCRCCLFYSCCVSTIHIIHHNITENGKEEKKKNRESVCLCILVYSCWYYTPISLRSLFNVFFLSFFFGSAFIFIIPLLWRYSYAVGFCSSSILRNGQTMVAM